MKQRDGLLTYPPPHYEEKSTPSSSSFSRTSPTLVWIIVSLSALFFILGLIHLVIRYLIKTRPSFSMIHHSNRYHDSTRLHHLFTLHDSGLDRSSIDSLPVFEYKEIMCLEEPFDCAVCLSEFSFEDKLRLLPICGHAFHIHCIGTWLLSNSTCPLCRASLLETCLPIENPYQQSTLNIVTEVTEMSCNKYEVAGSKKSPDSTVLSQSGEIEKRVMSVRLGKLRNFNGEVGPGIDSRRCYSMGSYEYVVGELNLKVALGSVGEVKSLSVSKVWLWSNRNRVPTSLDATMWVPCNNHFSLGLSNGNATQMV